MWGKSGGGNSLEFSRIDDKKHELSDSESTMSLGARGKTTDIQIHHGETPEDEKCSLSLNSNQRKQTDYPRRYNNWNWPGFFFLPAIMLARNTENITFKTLRENGQPRIPYAVKLWFKNWGKMKFKRDPKVHFSAKGKLLCHNLFTHSPSLHFGLFLVWRKWWFYVIMYLLSDVVL